MEYKEQKLMEGSPWVEYSANEKIKYFPNDLLIMSQNILYSPPFCQESKSGKDSIWLALTEVAWEGVTIVF